MAVQEIWANSGWAFNDGSDGYSFSGTVNLPHEMPFAVAQVTLTRSAYFGTPGWNQVYITGYTANGNPVPVTDGSVILGISNADSFSFQGDTLDGAITASMTVFCFE
ncbi:MAG TPA: hypothetical protein VN917_07165 [Xanthobacteraceae bacterium]|nr:hypothetical protein [Xanthobacteraceae bacterium]